jgi:putative chitinase
VLGSLRAFCRAAGLDCPDFVKDPDAVNTDPWEGLLPLFYWDTRDLNRWADEGDAETIRAHTRPFAQGET